MNAYIFYVTHCARGVVDNRYISFILNDTFSKEKKMKKERKVIIKFCLNADKEVLNSPRYWITSLPITLAASRQETSNINSQHAKLTNFDYVQYEIIQLLLRNVIIFVILPLRSEHSLIFNSGEIYFPIACSQPIYVQRMCSLCFFFLARSTR